MEINYICSLGPLCHTAQFLKKNKLKMCSYPFDWIYSNLDNIIHCIENDFTIFLDKSYYISIANNEKGYLDKRCGHSYYNSSQYDLVFNHHNPAKNDNDYNYYIRCVDRFKNLLKYEEHKLFITIITNINTDTIHETMKNNIIEFNNKFSKYTKNYTLLVIFHIPNKENNYHNFTYNNNIHFMELHTLSSSNGIHFNNSDDNTYLDNIIKSTYNFNIKK